MNANNEQVCAEEVQSYLRDNPGIKIQGSLSSLLDKYCKIRLGPVSTLTDIQMMDVLGDGYGQLYLKEDKSAYRRCALCGVEKSAYGKQFLGHCKTHTSKKKIGAFEAVRVDYYGKQQYIKEWNRNKLKELFEQASDRCSSVSVISI